VRDGSDDKSNNVSNQIDFIIMHKMKTISMFEQKFIQSILIDLIGFNQTTKKEETQSIRSKRRMLPFT